MVESAIYKYCGHRDFRWLKMTTFYLYMFYLLQHPTRKKEDTSAVNMRKLCQANFSLNCWWRQVFPQCFRFNNLISISIFLYLYTGRAVQNSSHKINNHRKFVVTGIQWLLS